MGMFDWLVRSVPIVIVLDGVITDCLDTREHILLVGSVGTDRL